MQRREGVETGEENNRGIPYVLRKALFTVQIPKVKTK